MTISFRLITMFLRLLLVLLLVLHADLCLPISPSLLCPVQYVVYVLEPVNECTKTVLFVTFIIRASLVDPPPPSGYSRLGPAASITNVVMVTVVATYITFPHTYFVMDSISEINDFSIQLNENSPLKCLLIKCLWQLIRN